ncbi:MAG: dynamin family protein, partial [Thermodesulfobacteriota bacterium]
MDEKTIQDHIGRRVEERLAPLFRRYGMPAEDLAASLRWRPIALVIGNYSSGKSTLINELCGRPIQRTGQAPTDDSFTILTAPEGDGPEAEIPGATLINDDRLPFAAFRTHGEQFIAHFRMKTVAAPALQDLAIIDTPGMLDSVTEKDRGYDYLKVLGEFARLADLIVLLFDPHKAGTIKETYVTIRNTLPEASGEDRIVFVMSRIDECDNLADLVRSYGTLCWNLSQMTGRKDIPRIFLTFAPSVTEPPAGYEVWQQERVELKERILAAPSLRTGHMLQNIDKKVQELRLVAEAMAAFAVAGRQSLALAVRVALALGAVGFFFLDVAGHALV